jgi:hypothetical protein
MVGTQQLMSRTEIEIRGFFNEMIIGASGNIDVNLIELTSSIFCTAKMIADKAKTFFASRLKRSAQSEQPSDQLAKRSPANVILTQRHTRSKERAHSLSSATDDSAAMATEQPDE